MTKYSWPWSYSTLQCLFYLYSVSLGDALTTADVQPFFAKKFLLGKKNRKFLGKGGLRHKFEWTLVRITKKLSFCPFKPWSTNFFGNFLTLIRWANCPQQIKKLFFSATEYPYCCIITFVCCLEVYLKKLIYFDPGGNLDGCLSSRVPKISLAGSISGSIWGSMKVQEDSLVQSIVSG